MRAARSADGRYRAAVIEDDTARSEPGGAEPVSAEPGGAQALEQYRARARELTGVLAEHVALVDRGGDGWAESAGALQAAVDAFAEAERALRGTSPLVTGGPGGPAGDEGGEEDDDAGWPLPDASQEEAPVVTVLGRWDYVVTDAAALVQHGRAAHLAVHPRDDHEDAVLRVPSVTAAVDAVLRGPVLEALEGAPGLEPVASASQVLQHAGSSDEELETDPFGLTRGPAPAADDLCGCGHVRDPQDRHIRFSLPDALFERVSAGEEVPDLWMSHDDPDSSVMLAAPGLGSFVRVLLRVRLDDGTGLTYGTWLQVEHDELLRANEVWFAPEYSDLVLEGRLANDVPPGGVLGAHARAVVTDPDATPSIDSSDDSVLARVLTEVWPAHLHPGA